MQYEVGKDPYIDKDTGLFRNRLGIRDAATLQQAEATNTTVRLAYLEEFPIRDKFNLEYLQKLHEFIFADLYDWAGKIRTVEMTKGGTEFTKVDAIQNYARTIFAELELDNYLIGLEQAEFTRRLAHYYSELNLLHPFREGNGRVLRAFIQALARFCGWRLDWSTLDSSVNLAACIAAYHGDESQLSDMLSPMLTWYGPDFWEANKAP